jgi:hypothetical protein
MTLLLSIIAVAAFIKFIHYSIGSPIHADFYSGRIFSFYGRFISDRYEAWELKESARVWAKYGRWKQDQDKQLQSDLDKCDSITATYLYNEYLERVDIAHKKVESTMRANPYSMLGACPICFGTWVGLLTWSVLVFFTGIAWWWIILGTPLSVWLSRFVNYK